MKILTAAQIREADIFTINHEPIASIELMERAALAATSYIDKILPQNAGTIRVFCGSGNNGGDGFAIARQLLNLGYRCEVYALNAAKGRSPDCEINLQRFYSIVPGQLYYINAAGDFPVVENTDIAIDALLGTGLSRPVKGLFEELIRYINASGARIISIDVPSGLQCEDSFVISNESAIIKAWHTLTFQAPKLSFLLCQNYIYTGYWEVLEIGLSKEYLDKAETNYYYLEGHDLAKILKIRGQCDHKGTYGHALIWAGSHGKIGAAVLCAHACLRTGAGLTTAYIPGCGYDIMQISLPEVMAIVDENKKFLTNSPDTFHFTTIGIGPGIGKAAGTKDALGKLLKYFKKPVVLDADALNILAEEPALIEKIPANSILTPHPKEFARLAGECKNDWERLAKASEFAERHNCILILKSAYTSIHIPGGEVYFNSTGNPGMAKGGSGDALTGMLTALLSQGYGQREAAMLGVYLHGLAGDIAAAKYGQYSMTAGNLIAEIGEGFKRIEEEEDFLPL